VKYLLEGGATVHGAVRDPDNPEKVAHLQAMADAAPGTLRLFRADLLDQGSYAEAMAGCGVVIHTASPFTMIVEDPQRDLIDPAVLGTRNVLEQANRTQSVHRVVLTSSCAAILGANTDIAREPGGRMTEAMWNTTSSIDDNPYSYSKTLAEREAWKIAEAQDRWDLVVINPSFVIGPATKPGTESESFRLVRQYGDGTMKAGAPRWCIGVVDVRDVAQAHIAAAFTPGAKGRHILSGRDSDFVELAAALREKFGDRYPIPRKALPKAMVWLVGPMINKAMTRKAIARNVNVPWNTDNSKSIEELGVTYRSFAESITEMFQQQIDAGEFAKR
jgi:dihydroflavonol-4-reductase